MKNKLIIPHSLSFNGVKHRIKFVKSIDNGKAWAKINYKDKLILISRENYDIDKVISCLFHEIYHAFIFYYGIEGNQEQNATCFQYFMRDVLIQMNCRLGNFKI